MRPDLAGRPLVVLSNNDGCVIARTAEAKALGIKMGAPFFQVRPLTATVGLVALSANFDLYGDLSARMMSVIGQFSPVQEVYSIDESFLDLTGIAGTGREIGSQIRSRVLQWVGIPTCVGVGGTKTLAKLANHLAKTMPRLQGVCDLSQLDSQALMRAIRHVPVGEVWGVGRRTAAQLESLGIHTAADLACADLQVLQRRFSVVLARTAQELRGVACMDMDMAPEPKQQIMCSRSFGAAVHEKAHLAQALSTFAARAAEKLRAQGSMTAAAMVFIRTSPFRKDPQYSGSIVARVPYPTDCTLTLTAAVLAALDAIYRPDYRYAKAGVCLLDLVDAPTAGAQGRLFDDSQIAIQQHSAGAGHLMEVVDALNQRFGHNAVSTASAASAPAAPWRMRQERKTPAYTTDWNDIVSVWR